jgi:hypothetical protein
MHVKVTSGRLDEVTRQTAAVADSWLRRGNAVKAGTSRDCADVNRNLSGVKGRAANEGESRAVADLQ